MSRPRACAAILRDDQILMVHHAHNGRSFWTLPGGGVEAGESFAQAAVREALEECGLAVKITRFLFERPYAYGQEQTFLAEIIGEELPYPGLDPELPPDEQWITAVRWFPLAEMRDDRQVKLVIQVLAAGSATHP